MLYWLNHKEDLLAMADADRGRSSGLSALLDSYMYFFFLTSILCFGTLCCSSSSIETDNREESEEVVTKQDSIDVVVTIRAEDAK
mmetsp:Transcript_2385/g.3057  ORF Transcript_2385/g.3057 Transcript_2385/m.3057 type:complete len:85 (+) Transcript_2385:973-1227(+)